MAAKLPLIPSTVVGSHGRAGWWHLGVKAWEAGEMGPADLDEMLDDAADTAIRDMERAGVDVFTDGEVRRLDGYVDAQNAERFDPGHPALIFPPRRRSLKLVRRPAGDRGGLRQKRGARSAPRRS